MSDALSAKASRYDAALAAFIDRLRADRTVLAAVRLGSGAPATLWDADSLSLWVIIADGTQPRRRSDGDQPRVWRTAVEDDLDLHCELIERAKFKRMVEGADRNTASWSAFCARSLIYCTDDGIARWFEIANAPSGRDQRHDQLTVACWVAGALRRVRRRLELQEALEPAIGDALHLAHAVAVLAIIDRGEIVEHHVMARALELEPELLGACYTAVLASRDEAALHAACDAAEAMLSGRWEPLMEPVLRFLDRCGTPVPLSELCEHFATTALYPWQLSAACEWMVAQGHLVKLGAPAPLTRKSRVQIDEPVYTRS